MHDQTAMRTEGIAEQLCLHPRVKAKVDEGYRGLANDFPNQVQAPPRKPKNTVSLGENYAWREARRRQSSERICVEHTIGEEKKWRPLQRYLGRRDSYAETHAAIAGLVSDRAARRPTRLAPHATVSSVLTAVREALRWLAPSDIHGFEQLLRGRRRDRPSAASRGAGQKRACRGRRVPAAWPLRLRNDDNGPGLNELGAAHAAGRPHAIPAEKKPAFESVLVFIPHYPKRASGRSARSNCQNLWVESLVLWLSLVARAIGLGIQ